MVNKLDLAIGRSYLIVIPSGWLGRPWDSIYELLSVTDEDHVLRLQFSNDVCIDIEGSHQKIFLSDSIFLMSDSSSFPSKMQKYKFGQGTYLLLRGELQAEQRLFEIHQAFNAIQSSRPAK